MDGTGGSSEAAEKVVSEIKESGGEAILMEVRSLIEMVQRAWLIMRRRRG